MGLLSIAAFVLKLRSGSVMPGVPGSITSGSSADSLSLVAGLRAEFPDLAKFDALPPKPADLTPGFAATALLPELDALLRLTFAGEHQRR